MGVWINRKRFWAVKLIYNNENLNNSIKYDRGVWKMRNEKWEMRMRMRMRMKMRMRIKMKMKNENKVMNSKKKKNNELSH